MTATIVANQTDIAELAVVVQLAGTSATLTFPCIALVNAAAGAFALTLPTAAQMGVGQRVSVKKIEAGGNAITVTPPSGFIDGAASATLAGGARNEATYVWDGANWWLVTAGGGGGGGGSSIQLAVTAALTPTLLTGTWIQVTTCPVGGGVIFPAAVSPGVALFVTNQGANTLLVFPPTGGQWNALGTNVAWSIAPGLSQAFFPLTVTQGYTA
jgi:FlaG/FlaF family flagellin (archaellin)